MRNKVNLSILFCFLFFIEGFTQDYSAMFLGHPIGEEKTKTKTSRFYSFNFQRTTPHSKQKITFSYFDNKYHTEEGGFNKSLLFIPRFYFLEDTNSFNLGFLLLKSYHSPISGIIVAPVGGYQRKLFKNIYASIDFFDDDLPAYYSISLGYKPDIKDFDVSFGFSKQEEELYHIKFKYTLLDLFPFSFNYGYKYPINEHVFYFYIGVKV